MYYNLLTMNPRQPISSLMRYSLGAVQKVFLQMKLYLILQFWCSICETVIAYRAQQTPRSKGQEVPPTGVLPMLPADPRPINVKERSSNSIY